MPTQCSQEELDLGSSGGRKLESAFELTFTSCFHLHY